MKFAIVVVFCLALQQHIPSTFSESHCSAAEYVGGPKHAPLNIDTSYATEVKTRGPLTFTVGDYETFIVKNTGSTVEITSAQNQTINSVTGGVLENEIYDFYKITYFWDHDFNGLATFSVDGTLWPLTVQLVYTKRSCKPPMNPFNEPLGVLVVPTQITVEGAIANPHFVTFEKILRNITKAGSSYTIKGNVRETVYAFFDQDALNYPFYYTYIGVYYDQSSKSNSTMCSSARYIVSSKSRTGYVAVCQFTAFTDLEGFTNTPLTSIQTSFPSRGKIISQAPGLKENVIYKPPKTP